MSSIIHNYLVKPTHSKIQLNRYYTFIFQCIKANETRLLEYTENHHICPRSMFPELENSDFNIVKLTARQHFIAHWMLWKTYRNSSMSYAFLMLHRSNSGQKRYYNSRTHENIKKEYSNIQKIKQLGKGNSFYGKNHSEETRRKISESKKGKPNNSWNTGLTKESSNKLAIVGEKISKMKKGVPSKLKGVKGKPASIETKNKMSLIRKGNYFWWNNGAINKRQKESPEGINWKRGRLISSL